MSPRGRSTDRHECSVKWQRDNLKDALKTKLFKDACESCGLRNETAGMFVKLGRDFVWSQFKETLGIAVELFANSVFTIVKERKRKWDKDKEEGGVQTESSKKAKIASKEVVSTRLGV
jgi:hypothetical protein